jgi:hypothetical protein
MVFARSRKLLLLSVQIIAIQVPLTTGSGGAYHPAPAKYVLPGHPAVRVVMSQDIGDLTSRGGRKKFGEFL